MRENEERMMHSEELMRKLRNTDNSGHYVRPCTHNVRVHALRLHQCQVQWTLRLPAQAQRSCACTLLGLKERNAKFSGHYVRQCTHNFRAHALRSDQCTNLSTSLLTNGRAFTSCSLLFPHFPPGNVPSEYISVLLLLPT